LRGKREKRDRDTERIVEEIRNRCRRRFSKMLVVGKGKEKVGDEGQKRMKMEDRTIYRRESRL
jgi:hypothetical protein